MQPSGLSHAIPPVTRFDAATIASAFGVDVRASLIPEMAGKSISPIKVRNEGIVTSPENAVAGDGAKRAALALRPPA